MEVIYTIMDQHGQHGGSPMEKIPTANNISHGIPVAKSARIPQEPTKEQDAKNRSRRSNFLIAVGQTKQATFFFCS